MHIKIYSLMKQLFFSKKRSDKSSRFSQQLSPNCGPTISGEQLNTSTINSSSLVGFSSRYSSHFLSVLFKAASHCSSPRAKQRARDRDSWAVSAAFSKVCKLLLFFRSRFSNFLVSLSDLLLFATLFCFFNMIALKSSFFYLESVYVRICLEYLCLCSFVRCLCCESWMLLEDLWLVRCRSDWSGS